MTPLSDISIRLHRDDDVVVLKRPVKAGLAFADTDGRTFTLRTDLLRGHKLATREVRDGEPLRRYGQVIGFARGDIAPGDHVHSHNLVVRDFTREHEFGTDVRPLPPVPAGEERGFLGYARPPDVSARATTSPSSPA